MKQFGTSAFNMFIFSFLYDNNQRMLLYKNTYFAYMSKHGIERAVICTMLTGWTMGQSP